MRIEIDTYESDCRGRSRAERGMPARAKEDPKGGNHPASPRDCPYGASNRLLFNAQQYNIRKALSDALSRFSNTLAQSYSGGNPLSGVCPYSGHSGCLRILIEVKLKPLHPSGDALRPGHGRPLGEPRPGEPCDSSRNS
jgi:hypothetical protein